jgi:hypothetical protein
MSTATPYGYALRVAGHLDPHCAPGSVTSS